MTTTKMVVAQQEQLIKIRAAVNGWISETFPELRRFLMHTAPEYSPAESAWVVTLATKDTEGKTIQVGRVLVNDEDGHVNGQDPESITTQIRDILAKGPQAHIDVDRLAGPGYDFIFGDGIAAAGDLADSSIDLLLTDPPYGISTPYTAEGQVPRRLRKDGRDFIMPRGDFGAWDDGLAPEAWLPVMLPKVRGWAVTFCAQAQIGDYCALLKAHKFVAVGTVVWQKTNPVPFNHRFKPINAWEAIVVGKRPGTRFNGKSVHNVLRYKSPSPQQRIHTTQKPLPLIERLTELFSSPGDTILDPFAGSGTTVIAGARMGRKVLAFENDRGVYRAACARIAEALA
ncbi:MAG: site-specific DNA-methyltransferase [Chloroflexota bacterium]|nr:site-specific DNA-methyltransferase [Chloroflexota bacterium]